MHHAVRKHCRKLLAGALLAVSGVTFASDDCNITDSGKCDVETAKYGAVYSPGQGVPKECPPPDPVDFTTYCIANTIAPDPAHLNCEYGSRNYICEAWPQDDDPPNSPQPKLSYGWSATGSLGVPAGSQYNPGRIIKCLRSGLGNLTVTVTSPAGLVGTRTETLICP